MRLTGTEIQERGSNGKAKLCDGCGAWLCTERGCKLFRIEGGYVCYGRGQRFGIDSAGVPFRSQIKGFRPGS